MDKLIYTYAKDLHHVAPAISREQMVQIYKHCMSKAKEFYSIELYTHEENVDLFQDIVDTIKIIPDDYPLYFQDDIKFYVFQKEEPPFTLIDGDIEIYKPIQFPEGDVIFEKLIKDNPNDDFFKKMLVPLLKENIEKVITFWKHYDHTYNLGIVNVNNSKFVKPFLAEYEKLKEYYKKVIEPKYQLLANNQVIEMATCTYFLSMYLEVNNYNIEVIPYYNLDAFRHYSGYKEKWELLNKINKVDKLI